MFLLALAALGSLTLSDRVVAVVGDAPLLYSDVLAYLSEESYDPSGTERDSVMYETALQALIDERILIEAASLAGFHPSDEAAAEMAEARIAEMTEEFGGEEGLLRALGQAGMDMEGLRERLRRTLADQQAASDFVRARAGAALSSLPADPFAYLDDNMEMLEQELMPRHLGWILFPVLAGDSTASAALELLEDIRQRVLDGEDFSELAALYSEDPGSAAAGGDLGEFARGDMTPTFERALEALRPGEMTMPFMSPYGAHLAILDSRSPDGTMRARHILIVAAAGDSDLERVSALAASVADSVRAGLTGFPEAAARYSCDPSTASGGGDLGLVFVRRNLPEAASALAGLGPGGLSAPVPVQEGTAVAVFTIFGEDARVDWSSYDRTWLMDLVRNIEYDHSVSSLVDSLRTVVPVVRPAYED
jgi:peptidyl-prolyl cis-trans isomerase SurA